jgi:hypothetical protein
MAFAVDFGLRVDEVCLLRLQKLLAAFSSWPSVSQDLMGFVILLTISQLVIDMCLGLQPW